MISLSSIFYQKTNSVGNYNYNNKIYSPCEWGHHFHKNFELVYVMEGEIEVCLDDKMGIVREGEFVLAFPNSIHCLHTPKYAKVWIGVFSDDYVTDFAAMIHEKTSPNLTFTCDENEMNYLNKVLLNKNEKTDICSLKACLYMVCSKFLKSANLIPKEKIKPDLAHLIIEYVEKNFNNEITLYDIAKKFGYEYHYFSRCFRSIFHTSFKNFLNLYRFDYARSLVVKTDKNMTDIAIESGFGSLRNFNRIYKSIAKTTPTEHRKGVLKNKRCGK